MFVTAFHSTPPQSIALLRATPQQPAATNELATTTGDVLDLRTPNDEPPPQSQKIETTLARLPADASASTEISLAPGSPQETTISFQPPVATVEPLDPEHDVLEIRTPLDESPPSPKKIQTTVARLPENTDESSEVQLASSGPQETVISVEQPLPYETPPELPSHRSTLPADTADNEEISQVESGGQVVNILSAEPDSIEAESISSENPQSVDIGASADASLSDEGVEQTTTATEDSPTVPPLPEHAPQETPSSIQGAIGRTTPGSVSPPVSQPIEPPGTDAKVEAFRTSQQAQSLGEVDDADVPTQVGADLLQSIQRNVATNSGLQWDANSQQNLLAQLLLQPR